MSRLDELQASLFGDRDAVQRLVSDEATRQGVPPNVMLAVVRQESGFNPQAKSPKGATGVTQLMPGTAADLGVDPTDTVQNIRGGVQYFKQLQEQFPGNVSHQLAAYNAGPDAVTRHGGVPPYPETQRYVKNILNMLGPQTAEAASSKPPQSRLDFLTDSLFGGQPPGQPAPTAPSGPSPTSAPAPQAPIPSGVASPEEAQAAVQRLREGRPSPEPEMLSPNVAMDQPRPRPPLAAQPPLHPAGGGTPEDFAKMQQDVNAWEAGAIRMAGPVVGGVLGSAVAAPLTGAALGGVGANKLTTALGLHPPEPQTPAFTPIPKGSLPFDKEYELTIPAGLGVGATPNDVVAAAAPFATAIAGDVVHGAVRLAGKGTPFASAIKEAEEATIKARRAWQERLSEANAVGGQNTQAGQDALAKAKALQNDYAMRAAERQRVIAGREKKYADYLTTVETENQQGPQAALDRVQRLQDEYHAGTATRQEVIDANNVAYEKSLQGQAEALQTAQAIPGRFKPTKAAASLYDEAGAVARNTPVDMQPVQQVASDIIERRGLLPTGEPRPLPGVLQKSFDAVKNALPGTDAEVIRNEMKALGPLTRSPNGEIRGLAKQLFGAYGDAMEATGETGVLYGQANAAWRKEMALQDVAEWLQPGRGVVRVVQVGDKLRPKIDIGAFVTKFEKAMTDPLFKNSFSPEEAANLRTALYSLETTPKMPLGPPKMPPPVPEPTPEQLAKAGEWTPRVPKTPPAEPAPVSLPPNVSFTEKTVPYVGPYPAAVEPTVGERKPFFSWANLRHELMGASLGGGAGAAVGWPGAGSIVGGGIAGGIIAEEQMGYWLAKGLLTPQLRPLVLKALDNPNAFIDPKVFPLLAGVLGHGPLPAVSTGGKDTIATPQRRGMPK